MRDLGLGLAAGLVFWPLALAHAELARVPASAAMGTAVVAPVVYAFLGSLPMLDLQTGSAMALCLSQIMDESDKFGLTPEEMATATALLVGLCNLLMGFLDLGGMAELFSQPLLRGRVHSMAILVIMAQSRTLLGIREVEHGPMPVMKGPAVAAKIPETHINTAGLSVLLVALLLGLRYVGQVRAKTASETHALNGASATSPGRQGRCCGCLAIAKRVGGAVLEVAITANNLCGLVVGCIVVSFWRNSQIELLESPSPPKFSVSVPVLTFTQVTTLLPTAALMAFLSFGGHVVVADRVRRKGDRFSPRTDLLVVGASGILTSLLGGMAPGANLPVSQTLVKGTSSMASLGNALGHLMAFSMVTRVSWLQKVPACAPAAILAVEFAPILITMPGIIRHLVVEAAPGATWSSIRRSPSSFARSMIASDFGIYLSALACPLFLGIINGSLAAIILELSVAMARFAGPGLKYLGRVPGRREMYDEIGVEGSTAVGLPHVDLVRLAGSRWFGNAAATTRTAQQLRRSSGREVLAVVIDMRMVDFFDETALTLYKREWLNNPGLGVRLFVSNCNSQVRRQIKTSGLAAAFDQPEEAYVDFHAAVELAETYVETEKASRLAISIGKQRPL